MENFIQLFDIIKKRPFIENYTTLGYNTAISQRFAGKSSQVDDKRTEPTDLEKAEAKAGLILLKKDIDKLIKTL